MEFERLLKSTIEEPTIEKCVELLRKAKSYERIKELFDLACKIRDEYLGRTIKLDSFVYPVKKCEIEKYCIYCSNYVEKFRIDALNLEEFEKAVDFIRDCGLKRITLEGGYNENNDDVVDFVKVSKKANLEVILDVYPIKDLKKFKVSEIYSSIEIADSELFRYFKPSESLEDRIKLAENICKEKIRLASTVLIGLPKTDYEIWVKSLFTLRNFPELKHCTISSFHPVSGTPLENCKPLPSITVAKFVSLARILFKDKDISAGGSVGDLQTLPLMLISGVNRVYFGAYVCKLRNRAELESVFKPEYDVKVEKDLVFANPSSEIEKICREFGFELE